MNKSAWEKYQNQLETEPEGWAKSFEQILNEHLKEVNDE